MKKRTVIFLCLLPLFLCVVLAVLYVCRYYHADSSALAALESDAEVTVQKTADGWLFDGPSEDTALIFYPGAKVEETAYAPLLHTLARDGMDVFLVKMPARLAIFGIHRAKAIQQNDSYDTWYIGGHSMGGAMAAWYAAESGGGLEGLILCAAYAPKPLDSSLRVLSIYGSEDLVLNMDKYEEGKQFLPADAVEHIIVGGNHAQFGNYGPQSGDGPANISPEAQQREAAECILDALRKK